MPLLAAAPSTLPVWLEYRCLLASPLVCTVTPLLTVCAVQAILHVIGMLTDKKIQQYRPIVDSYFETIFAFPSAHSVLLE